MTEIEQSCKILGIGSDAGPGEVKRAYRDLVKVWHPDRFPGEPRLQEKALEQLKSINLAYKTIMAHGVNLKPAERGPVKGETGYAAAGKTRLFPGRRQIAAGLGLTLALTLAFLLIFPLIRGDLAEIPYNLGSSYLQSGHYHEALKAFRAAVWINPGAKAYTSLGETLYKLEDYVRAKEAFGNAVLANPSGIKPYCGLALSYGKLGDADMEMETYRQALKMNPASPEAYYNLGAACERNGAYREAEEAYNQTLRIDPRSEAALHGLAMVRAHLGRYREAVEALEKAVRVNPNNAGTYNDMGAMYNKLGLSRQELDAYRKAIELDPSSKEAHFNFALANLNLGNGNAAQKELEILQTIAPSLGFELYRIMNRKRAEIPITMQNRN